MPLIGMSLAMHTTVKLCGRENFFLSVALSEIGLNLYMSIQFLWVISFLGGIPNDTNSLQEAVETVERTSALLSIFLISVAVIEFGLISYIE